MQVGGAISDSTMADKATNDTAAYIRSLAEKRGRNAEWAETAVRQSISITAREALEQNVIDLMAPTVAALLDSIDGRQVEVLSATRILETAGARIVTIEMGLRERFLSRISDPNIAYILMILGVYGIMFELYNPGSVLPGVIGGICLILAFYSFQTLPVNFAGLLLIVLGAILFILEIKVPSYGVLAIGGIVAMALGSTMLFDTPGSIFRVSWSMIAPAVLATALFFAFAMGMGIRAQRIRPKGDLDEIVGMAGKARTDVGSDGTVFVVGEYWQARSEEPVQAGTTVQIICLDGNTLVVRAEQS